MSIELKEAIRRLVVNELVELNLNGKKIGDPGVQALARVLPQYHALTTLEL